jgi:hypothetical protein
MGVASVSRLAILLLEFADKVSQPVYAQTSYLSSTLLLIQLKFSSSYTHKNNYQTAYYNTT